MIAAGEKAITDQQKVIEKQKEEIKDVNLMLQTSNQEEARVKNALDAQEKKDDSIWHNPFFLIGLGLVGGVVTAAALHIGSSSSTTIVTGSK